MSADLDTPMSDEDVVISMLEQARGHEVHAADVRSRLQRDPFELLRRMAWRGRIEKVDVGRYRLPAEQEVVRE